MTTAQGWQRRPSLLAWLRRRSGSPSVKANRFAKGIKAILDKLGLTEEQAAMVPGVIEATVLELSTG